MTLRETEPQILDYIRRRLGHPVVKVELSDDQLRDAIADAKRWWASWVGQLKSVTLTTTGSSVIEEATIGSDVDTVVDVIFDFEAGGDLTQLYAWANVEISPYTFVYGGGVDYSELLQYLQQREMAKRMVSADADWAWDEASRVLRLSPTMSAGRTIMVYYQSNDVEIGVLTNSEVDLVRKYALAQAMRTLATIRMKYSDRPSATGSFTMDGDAMWANAEAIQAEVEEKMRQVQRPVAFWLE